MVTLSISFMPTNHIKLVLVLCFGSSLITLEHLKQDRSNFCTHMICCIRQVLALGEHSTHKLAWSDGQGQLNHFCCILSPYKTKKQQHLNCTETKFLPRNDELFV